MSDSWQTLLDQAEDLPNTPEKVAILEQAVRLADRDGTERDQYECRVELIDAANYAGEPQKVMVAFSWCLAKYDANPDDYWDDDIMWRYKWVSERLSCFPQVSKQKIAELHDDMEERFKKLSYSTRPVHGGRFSNAFRMGDFEAAESHYKVYTKTRRDWMSNCQACECDVTVDYFIRLGHNKRAINKAKPILDGKLSCEEVPQVTYATVLRPFVLEGRVEEAERYHKIGYRKVAKNREFLHSIAEHLEYLSFIQADAKVVRLLEQHAPIASAANDPSSKFTFYAAAAGAFSALASRKPRPKKISLPTEFPIYRDESKYSPADISDYYRAEAQKLADAFNERNENDHYTNLIERSRAFCHAETS